MAGLGWTNYAEKYCWNNWTKIVVFECLTGKETWRKINGSMPPLTRLHLSLFIKSWTRWGRWAKLWHPASRDVVAPSGWAECCRRWKCDAKCTPAIVQLYRMQRQRGCGRFRVIQVPWCLSCIHRERYFLENIKQNLECRLSNESYNTPGRYYSSGSLIDLSDKRYFEI